MGRDLPKAYKDVDDDPHQMGGNFIVEFEPQERKGFEDVYFKLLRDLEEVLGRHVDLVEEGTVRNPYMLASINRTKRLLYAA